MPVLKRPGAKVTTANASKAQKRPAASLNESVAALKSGIVESDEDENDPDATGSDARILRNKAKGEKWARMRAAGQIPKHIVDLYDNGAEGSLSKRDFRTQIVNALFEKSTTTGLFQMNTKQKMFTEAFKVYQAKYARDEQEGFAKSILKGLYFHNSEEAGSV